MHPVPFLDLHSVNRRLEARFLREMKALYRAGSFVGGPAVEAFEGGFAAATGARHCVAVSSGTMALHLSLVAAGVKAGDEVVLPALTFPGAAGPVVHLGARPVFADVSPRDACLDPMSVARVITRKTRAIVATHLFGHPADMDTLRLLAGKRVALIEDAAQAHGGTWRGRPLGTLGEFGCFSFYPTKNLGGIGDGGAILTTSRRTAERLRRLRDHGQARRFHPVEAGYNARLNAVQALFLGLKLPSLAADNTRRTAIAARYLRVLRGNPDIVPLTPAREGRSAWHAFVVRARNRAAFAAQLDARGIGHQVYYPAALPDLPVYRAPERVECPVARALARTVVALPLHAGLRDSDVRAMCDALVP